MRQTVGRYLAAAVSMTCLLAMTIVISSLAPYAERSTVDFIRGPMDRPLLESIGQVYEARRTGISTFWFDGMHYTVKNLPDEYVDYSAWWVRLP